MPDLRYMRFQTASLPFRRTGLRADNQRFVGGNNDAAAKADIAVVQHGRLAGRYRPLRRVENEFGGVLIEIAQFARCVGHAVAGFAGVAAGLGTLGQGET